LEKAKKEAEELVTKQKEENKAVSAKHESEIAAEEAVKKQKEEEVQTATKPVYKSKAILEQARADHERVI
jgi:hypothetical protein